MWVQFGNLEVQDIQGLHLVLILGLPSSTLQLCCVKTMPGCLASMRLGTLNHTFFPAA